MKTTVIRVNETSKENHVFEGVYSFGNSNLKSICKKISVQKTKMVEVLTDIQDQELCEKLKAWGEEACGSCLGVLESRLKKAE